MSYPKPREELAAQVDELLIQNMALAADNDSLRAAVQRLEAERHALLRRPKPRALSTDAKDAFQRPISRRIR